LNLNGRELRESCEEGETNPKMRRFALSPKLLFQRGRIDFAVLENHMEQNGS